MKIAATDMYHDHENRCLIDDCARQYCAPHRLLWRDCETVKADMEGDRDVIGGTRMVYELGACPECEHAYEMRKRQQILEEVQKAA